MHIPLIASLAHHVLPWITPEHVTPSPGTGEIITLQPIHALAHALHPTSSTPVLLFQNASTPSAFYSYPDISLLSAEETERHLLDYPAPHLASADLAIRTKAITVRRPRVRPPSILSWAYSARRSRGGLDTLPIPLSAGSNSTERTWVAPDYNDNHGDWEDVDVRAPDVDDRQTLITLAKITSNAYVEPDSGEWWPTHGYNATIPFGWEPDADGLRGHVVRQYISGMMLVVRHG